MGILRARHSTEDTAQTEMMNLAFGHFRAQALCVAATLGIADQLADGPKTAAAVAGPVGADTRALYRLMRALSSFGVFAETDDGRFELTPLASTLRSDSPSSVRPLLVLLGQSFHWGAWGHLLHSVRTGESAFEQVHGQRFFDYVAAHPEAEQAFGAWRTRQTELQVPAILDVYDFSRFGSIVDVGGGHGRLLSTILKANTRVHGTLFDLPEVMEAAHEPERSGVAGRCTKVGGSFFESLPGGADLYVLKTVLHHWNDELSLQILGNCRDAMTERSRLLVIEAVVPSPNAPHISKLMDLNMLVLYHGGQERTIDEYRSLLDRAGLEFMTVMPTRSPVSIIEARRRSN